MHRPIVGVAVAALGCRSNDGMGRSRNRMLDRATEHQKISDDRHERSWRAVEESQKVREKCIEAVERAQHSVG